MRRLVVIGAGPVGLEAALYGVQKGFEVTVLERGAVGASLLRWRPTRLFTPFAMNVSDRMKAVLGVQAPAEDALLTGPEFAATLQQVCTQPPLQGRVHVHTEVLSVGRARMTRRDRPGHPLRTERPFVLLSEGPDGEQEIEADVVLDCSGLAQPCRIGEGGRPALGERGLADRVVHYLGDLHSKKAELAGQRILIVGNGHSAANAVVWLSQVAADNPGTQITWAVRGLNKRPILAVAQDPLPERVGIVNQANDLASTTPPYLTVHRRAHVKSLTETPEGLRVQLSGERSGTFDVVCALTGYRPDHALSSELTVDTSPVSEGTARLYSALSNITDCLSVPQPSPEDLQTGEDGYYWVGTKSYGRMNTFLLNNGITQVETILDQEAS
jgi:thioredoxin reductase